MINAVAVSVLLSTVTELNTKTMIIFSIRFMLATDQSHSVLKRQLLSYVFYNMCLELEQ
jgi:hypothetical protein